MIQIRDKNKVYEAKIKNFLLPYYKAEGIENNGEEVKDISKVIRYLIDKEINSIKSNPV